MEIKPAAFMSYAHVDDAGGRLTEFRERLSIETHMQIGEEFPIIQDRDDIHWGQSWKERIENSLDEVTFLIPIITPSFFKSKNCRDELQRFLDREEKLDRNDLVLPVYYVDAPLLNNETKLANDELARTIAARQHVDWRDLRIEPFASPQVVKMLTRLGTQIRDALERVQELRGRTAPNLAPDTRGQQASGASLAQKQRGEPAGESGTTSRRPAAKIEPPTHVVDPMHRGDYATITAAIEAAQPGDRILVRPGSYEEGLVIDKPLEIVGEGDLDEIVIRASGKAALQFQTTMGRVTNLTLRQLGGGDWFGVDITQGRLELEGCDISSESLACVGIHHGGDPRLRRNRIHDSKEGGVFVYENGQGTLEDNEIFANALAGVEISEGGDPTLRRNHIRDGKQSGVFVTENGRGTLEDNDIFGNAHAGVGIEQGGNPTLRHNRINKNGREAVWVGDGGGGTVEDNDLRDNALGAWDVSADSRPNLKRARNEE